MKHFAYSILGCLLLSLNAAFAQKTWSFDGQDPLLSSDGKVFHNKRLFKGKEGNKRFPSLTFLFQNIIS